MRDAFARALLPAAVVMCALASSGAARAQPARSAWPMFGHDGAHTGQSQHSASANPGTLKWKFTTGSGIFTAPVIGADGTIYIGSTDQNFYAVNPDGSMKWKFATGEALRSAAAIGADGTIYFGDDYYNFYAIGPDGRLKWKFKSGGTGNTSPAIGADGTIYICSAEGALYAINPDGTKKWQVATDARFSPAIGADGTIYVSGIEDCKGICKSDLTAVSRSGKRKWKFRFDGDANSSPAVGGDGTIYVDGITIDYSDRTGNGGAPPQLYAVNPNGTLKWKFAAGARAISDASPAIGADGTIYIGSGYGVLQAIGANGSEKWELKIGGGSMPSSAIGADGTIYTGDGSSRLYAIEPDGSPKWKFNAEKARGGPDQMWTAPAIGADGTIYAGSLDYNLYAIGTPVSAPIASAAAVTPVAGKIVISRDKFSFGTVYVGGHFLGFVNVTADESNKETVRIEDISVSGINFELGNHRCVPGQPLDAGQSCTVDFIYTPSMATDGETDVGKVVVSTNASVVVPAGGVVPLSGGATGRGTPNYGGITCRAFSKKLQANPDDQTMYYWAMGFMAGRNADIPNGDYGLINLPTDTQEQYIKSSCDDRSFVRDALVRLVDSLQKKPGGPGKALSCAAFSNTVEANPGDETMFLWAFGYMAALNTHLESRVTWFDGVPANEQREFIRGYCDEHPASAYVEAVLALFDHVRQGQGIPAPVWDTQRR